MTDETNPWTTLGTRRLVEDRYFAYDTDTVRHRSGHEHTHVALRSQVAGIAVLPIDAEGRTRLVGQYRYVLNRFTWELVRGSGPRGSDMLEAAQRELSEETGLGAERWLELFRLDASPGISNEVAACFVAWGLTSVASTPDPQESLSCRSVPFAEAVAAALSGAITDSPSVALILALAARASAGTVPDDLAQLLRGPGG
ncbi:NUDIX hydrolase [Methylobacterium sp. J-030]|uniref:NUDIX domain-containing protein n=1 Tax=Methylobacterium sp. J-030 TaxID=2836627 RepID=UPI001FBB0683|nr:NUDIX hydrolase [Methylobacterium sp. J-030]MCJ2073094.1 NUDIX hydrolase [Methylobacterium sp. J-030]